MSRKREVAIGPDGLPEPLRWRVLFWWKALFFGMLVDLGIEILLQQLGQQPFEMTQVVRAGLIGVVMGVAFPTTGLSVAVFLANREIRQARDAVAAGAGAATVRKERDEAVAASRRAVDKGARQATGTKTVVKGGDAERGPSATQGQGKKRPSDPEGDEGSDTLHRGRGEEAAGSGGGQA